VNEEVRVKLIADVLDKQVIDRDRRPMGKVDGIVILVRQRHLPPRVAALELGLATAANRLHPRLASWAQRIERWLGVHDGSPTRVSFDRLISSGIDVHVDIDARRTSALVWEIWWKRVLQHIPGAGA
jgi:hypothetical protein